MVRLVPSETSWLVNETARARHPGSPPPRPGWRRPGHGRRGAGRGRRPAAARPDLPPASVPDPGARPPGRVRAAGDPHLPRDGRPSGSSQSRWSSWGPPDPLAVLVTLTSLDPPDTANPAVSTLLDPGQLTFRALIPFRRDAAAIP